MEKISIIVPVYNVERYIQQCLNSILRQTYSNLEILLIDDGSTDSSGKICDDYAKKDSRIRVFHKENGGVSSARNIGLANSTGEWIGFIDPDDWIEPDMYEVLINNARLTNTAISVCNYKIIYSRDSSINMSKNNKINVLDYKESMSALLNGKSHYFCALWNKIIKKEKIKKQFNVTLRNGEDLLFLFEIFYNNRDKTVYCQSSKYNYYIRYDSAANIDILKKSMILEISVWEKIYFKLKYKNEFYSSAKIAKYMYKMSICNILRKASLSNTDFSREIYTKLRKEKSQVLVYSKEDGIKDFIKLTLIKLPYEVCNFSWNIWKKIKKYKIRRN